MQNEEIAASLKQSLASTNDGLMKFLASLQQAGLPNAVIGYRQLQMVLIQQRLWARNHNREELNALFQSIAHNAEELHRIFAAFAGIMEPLKDLPNITDASIESAGEQMTNTAKREVVKHATANEEPVKSHKKSTTKAIALPSRRRFQVIIELLMTHGSLPLKKLVQLANKAPEKLEKDIDCLVNVGAIHQTDGKSPRYQLSKKFIRQLLSTIPSS